MIWGRMALQNQALIFDAEQLSQAYGSQVNQLNFRSIILIFALLALFGAYFTTNYLITYRNTLRSISDLQTGIAAIGSGNLDLTLKADKRDEIGEISQSVNRMTRNLKTVTASKVDLEKEIAEREKAEMNLVLANRKITKILESIQDGFYEIDSNWNLIYMNKRAADFLGMEPKETLGKNIWELFPNSTGTIQEENYRSTMEKRKVRRFEYFSPYFNGWLATTVYPSAEGITILTSDITPRKKAEEELRENKVWEATSVYTRNLIEASLDPLVTISAEGKITDVNRATEEVTGYLRNQLIGSDFSEYFTEPEEARAGYRKAFTDGFVKDYPLAIRHKSGRITDVLYNATVYRDEAGKVQGVFAAARDVTERKKLENMLHESERLAAIGATAGMVGHDIRNPLQSIVGDIYLAKADLASMPESREKESLRESLDGIDIGAAYISKIVADLQDFAKPLNPCLEETNLKALIDDLLTKDGLPDSVKKQVKVENDAAIVMADSAFIRRIVGNLVSNAVQAMPDGGKLSIAAYKDSGDAVITVSDTGMGIPEDVRVKLFTPLFTTKSKGQGFGLAVVKRLTEALNGTVTFESQMGKGTKFFIRLPQK
jgi:PAS domain S-box-containing protein